jgi:hypothetical protein
VASDKGIGTPPVAFDDPPGQDRLHHEHGVIVEARCRFHLGDAEHLVPPQRIVSPVRQFVTVVSIEGGSAGVPSACSSLTVKVIQSSCPGPDGSLSIRGFTVLPGLARS